MKSKNHELDTIDLISWCTTNLLTKVLLCLKDQQTALKKQLTDMHKPAQQ